MRLPTTPRVLPLLLPALLAILADPGLARPSARAIEEADRAVERHSSEVVETLAEMVAIPTVGREDGSNADLPDFVRFRGLLARVAAELGMDFADHGDVVMIGLGNNPERLGLVTHGDVKAADPSQWARDPFTLDRESEPGMLIGRGTEDDKGAIAVGLWAMKSLAESGLPLRRRVEMIISLTEESDWNPFRDFLAGHPPPPLNIVFDSSYPVTVAEKAWGSVIVSFDLWRDGEGLDGPWLTELRGGTGLAQVPARASVRVAGADGSVEERLRTAAAAMGEPPVEVERSGDDLLVRATGVAVHSSEPETGVNAITRLAAVLGTVEWPPSAAAGAVRFINDLVGPGDHAERFGSLAYTDELMGPLTLTAARLRDKDWGLELGISFRRPAGRSREQVVALALDAVAGWQADQPPGYGFREVEVGASLPLDQRSAPHVPVLLDIYRHFTGDLDAGPVAIGGSTHAKLLPGAVSFGPAFPDLPYTGHSEHERVSRGNLLLALRMMTAALVELAAEAPPGR